MKEPQNFVRKYSLTAELLDFKYRRQNIPVSGTGAYVRQGIHNVAQLKSRMIEKWQHFNQMIIDAAVRQWRSCLRACSPASGEYSDHRI